MKKLKAIWQILRAKSIFLVCSKERIQVNMPGGVYGAADDSGYILNCDFVDNDFDRHE